MFRNPWVALCSVVLAVTLAAGTIVFLNRTVVETHHLEQAR